MTVLEQLRRMINEPTDTTYSDATLSGYITDASDDLNYAASVLWLEKVAALQDTVYDVSADGADYKYSQKIDNAKEMARLYASKRTPTSTLLIKDPEEEDDSEEL